LIRGRRSLTALFLAGALLAPPLARAAPSFSGPDLGMSGVGYGWNRTGNSGYYGDSARGPSLRLGWTVAGGIYLVGRAGRLLFYNRSERLEDASLGVGYIADPTGRAAAYVEADYVRANLTDVPAAAHEYYWRFVYGIRQDLGGPFVLGLRLDGEVNQHWAPHGLGERLSLAAGFAPLTLGVAWSHDLDVNAAQAFLRVSF
jgi:hypothetical protein